MSVPVIAFFNNKDGVGKTSLVYHVSSMLADLNYRVVAADMDPQGNLSAAFLSEQRLEELWPEGARLPTIYGAIEPIKRGIGDLIDPLLERINDNLVLIPGDMGLSEFEDDLAQVWPKCQDRDERAFRVISSFWRVLQRGAAIHNAHVVIMDLGPNLGAINRAALIAADYVVMPLGPDLYSIQGLQNLGPRLRAWRAGWAERKQKNPAANLELPNGSMTPIGYIVMQHSERKKYPVRAYHRWISRIPNAYREYVLEQKSLDIIPVETDTNCIAMVKHYRSLMPMSLESGKPIFHLKPGDGAIGAHVSTVRDAYKDFKKISLDILGRAHINMLDII